MNRRHFVAALGGAAATFPLAAGAQQPGKVYQVAILAGGDSVANLSETSSLRHWRALHQELRRLGYAEGRNLVVYRRSTEGDSRRIPKLVREVVSLKPHVVFAVRPDLVEALRAATTKIPIIAFSGDPVRYGFAASLARPGGNITGFTIDGGPGIIAKRMSLLREAVPAMTRLAALMLRQYWEGQIGDGHRESARQLGIALVGEPLDAPVNEQSYRRAFADMVREHADAVIVSPQSENLVHRRLIAELAAEAQLPSMHYWREHVEVGGLMAYMIDLADVLRSVAGYIDLILKGANPADLPFQQPTKYELIINLKTAKALGITIPRAILLRANEVIE